MKEQVKTPVIVVAAILVIGLVVFFGSKMLGNSGNLDQGQVQYTPGKPPWEETDPSKRGPGGAPGAGTEATGTAPAPAPQAGMPVGPPTVNNGG